MISRIQLVDAISAVALLPPKADNEPDDNTILHDNKDVLDDIILHERKSRTGVIASYSAYSHIAPFSSLFPPSLFTAYTVKYTSHECVYIYIYYTNCTYR